MATFGRSSAAGGARMALARTLLASLFLIAGARKLMTYAATAGYFAKLGMPYPEIVLPLVILLELGGGILLLLNRYTRWVAFALAAFTFGAGVIGHAFWNAEPAQYVNHLNNFLKNVAIVGGLIGVAFSRRG